MSAEGEALDGGCCSISCLSCASLRGVSCGLGELFGVAVWLLFDGLGEGCGEGAAEGSGDAEGDAAADGEGELDGSAEGV